MGASATSDRNKIAKLRDARDRAKGKPALDAGPMSELVGVRWAALRDWIDSAPQLEAKGLVKRGGQGEKWQIKPLATIDALIKHFEARVDKVAAKRRETFSGTGIVVPANEEAASFAEMKSMIEMTLSITMAKEKQGLYTRADEMAAFIESYNQTVTAAILGVKTKADPNGNLPPAIRAAVDDYLRGVASHVHAMASKFVKEQVREGVFSAGTR